MAKKMKKGGMLAMLSPLASLAESVKSGRAEGILGTTGLGAMYNAGRRKADARSGDGPSGPSGVTGMKSGGKVTRADGACMKGHTKGKMR